MDKKGLGWGYIVALVIGTMVLISLIYIAIRSQTETVGLIDWLFGRL